MKIVEFKYIKSDGRIKLGVPEYVSISNGNNRDGGCILNFETSDLSIGTKEKFELYLFTEDIEKITKEIWKSYFETEPSRAHKAFISLFGNILQNVELTLEDYDDIEEWSVESEDKDDPQSRRYMLCKTCDYATDNTIKFDKHLRASSIIISPFRAIVLGPYSSYLKSNTSSAIGSVVCSRGFIGFNPKLL